MTFEQGCYIVLTFAVGIFVGACAHMIACRR